jgi:hypothetical protein
MNNYQLGILLRNYRRLLESARKEITHNLPKELIQQEKDMDGDIEEKIPLLAPLDEVISSLQEDEEELLFMDQDEDF